MITKLRTAVQARYATGDKKTLLSNFISLSVLQLANYLLPLLVFPYLIRVLGIDKYGVVAYAQAVITFFIVITDYGFNLSATRDISIYRNDHQKVTSIFNAVLSSKLLLALLSFGLLALLVISIDKLNEHWLMYLLSYTIVIGQVLFPLWFFQGMQQMKYITVLNITSKVIFTGLIFCLIRQPADYLYVNLLLGLGGITASILSLYLIRKKFNLRFAFAPFVAIQQQLKEGWHLFTSTFAINVYMYANVFILGLYASDLLIGFYSIAEKLMQTLRQLLTVFSQAVFPHVCKVAVEESSKVYSLFKKLHFPFAVFILLCCIFLFIWAEPIVLLFSGQAVDHIIMLVRLLSIVPFVVALNIPAYQLMLAYNFKSSYSKVLIVGSLLNLALNLILARYLLATGTALAILATEIFITVGLYVILKLKHPSHSIL